MTNGDLALTTRRVRAYFAPVNRAARQATLFDPAVNGRFALDSPPAPWLDLGWIGGFERLSQTIVTPIRTSAPAVTQTQARTDVDATVKFSFQSWGKLQVSLSAGTQQMNLLPTAPGASPAGSGGLATAAWPLTSGSTATVLQVSSDAAALLTTESMVVVDVDYAPDITGFVGSGVSGAYVRTALSDVNYVRRVSLNVGRIASVAGNAVTLTLPLLAGVPTAAMKVSPVRGFCDREGSTYFQEWSALFVSEGQQGERVLWHYPRLQSMAGISEGSKQGASGLVDLQLTGCFRALPVQDGVDGERVVCFRSYLPS